MDSDYALLERFLNGDEDAFSNIVRRYQRPLYAFIYRMAGHAEDAMDICQKTFVQAFLKAGQFEKRSGFKTWLYRIAVNLAQDHLREKGRDRTMSISDMEDIKTCYPETVVASVIAAEEKTLLRSAVAGLPERQRITLLLRVYEELTFEEISEILQCPIGTAKANYHHAVSSLRKGPVGKYGL